MEHDEGGEWSIVRGKSGGGEWSTVRGESGASSCATSACSSNEYA